MFDYQIVLPIWYINLTKDTILLTTSIELYIKCAVQTTNSQDLISEGRSRKRPEQIAVLGYVQIAFSITLYSGRKELEKLTIKFILTLHMEKHFKLAGRLVLFTERSMVV